jgi:ribonuclease HI
LGSTVIDFVIASPGLLPRISDRSIQITQVLEWSDHAQIEMKVTGVADRSYGRPPIVLKPTVIEFAAPTELDILAANALKASVSAQEASRRLYGPIYKSGHPISVHIATSAKGKGVADAAFALYWGANSKRNLARRFDGPQTQARASLFAVLKAVLDSPPDKALAIFTSSEYVIRSFCYWAGDNAIRGWVCTHADVLKETAALIFKRVAPIEFRCVPSASANEPMAAVMKMARDALKSSFTLTMHLGDPAPRASISDTQPAHPLDVPKVFSALPEMPTPKARDIPSLSLEEIIDPDDNHRGRPR